MKVRPSQEFFNKLRDVITSTRKTLAENKKHRKELMQQLTQLKADIRKAENVCSHATTAGADPTGFIRSEITRRQKMLQNLRQDLLAAELFSKIEKHKFKLFHEQLDVFDQAVDPQKRKLK